MSFSLTFYSSLAKEEFQILKKKFFVSFLQF